MKGTYLCVPTNWACDITRCVTQSAIPEITKKLEENGIVIDERDRHNVFKLFEIEYVGYMSGTLRKGDKALLYWQDLDPEYDEGLALIIGEDEEEKDYDKEEEEDYEEEYEEEEYDEEEYEEEYEEEEYDEEEEEEEEEDY